MPKLTPRAFGLGAIDLQPMKKKCKVHPDFPYRDVLPPKLRDRVADRADKFAGKQCFHEMALMLTCLKKKDYDESRCAKEVQNYLGCHEKFVKELSQKAEIKTQVRREAGKFPVKVVNEMLKKFPQPK